jgi:hypothetical protein
LKAVGWVVLCLIVPEISRGQFMVCWAQNVSNSIVLFSGNLALVYDGQYRALAKRSWSLETIVKGKAQGTGGEPNCIKSSAPVTVK